MATLPRHTLFLLLQLYPFLLLSIFSSQSFQQHQNINPSDLKALLSIKNTLTELSAVSPFFSTWNLTAPDPCSTFSGVTCSSSSLHRRVTILSLGTSSSKLAGSLTTSISALTELTQLILSPGIVTGSIPPQLAQLTNLRVISLSNNRFTGTIPASFSILVNLHTLDLSHNQLAGSIPPSLLTELPNLKVLILASNSLTGELTENVSAPLLHLDLKSNQLEGPLPTSMPSSLRYLSLSQNRMWGPLTNGFESLSELVFLDLSMNQLSGPIPAQLFFRPTLSSLFLQRNNLSGGLPPMPKNNNKQQSSSSSYGPGSIVDLSHNSLSGELSTVLDGVESLFLNNNRLIGKVPEEYVKSVCRGSTRTLYLQHNYFTGISMEVGMVLPDTASLCLSYNCMVPPASLMTCPASAGEQLSRPVAQCSVFNRGSDKG